MDKPTLNRIALLHPKVREEMKKIINECNDALNGRSQVRIAQGLRTFTEQEQLYAQGRTLAGKKVTNAKGGQSVHNYGFAVDIVLIIDGKTASWDIKKDWDGDKVADWDECVKIFSKYGWSWGGSWTSFKDFPHFEKIGYNNWRVLINKQKDSQGYVII
jgi:peptidoglycan L-alanyl-D-glutamate endopeptidase CwlK